MVGVFFLVLICFIVETDVKMVFKVCSLHAVKKAYGLTGQAGTDVCRTEPRCHEFPSRGETPRAAAGWGRRRLRASSDTKQQLGLGRELL